jgi:hypothetical protein
MLWNLRAVSAALSLVFCALAYTLTGTSQIQPQSLAGAPADKAASPLCINEWMCYNRPLGTVL